MPGTDAFFVHGTDQYENVGVVLKYQGALECLYQVVAVFFVEVRFGQVNRTVIRVDGLTFIGDCFNGIGRVFVGDVTLFASKTARVEPQFVTGDDLVGIDDR